MPTSRNPGMSPRSRECEYALSSLPTTRQRNQPSAKRAEHFALAHAFQHRQVTIEVIGRQPRHRVAALNLPIRSVWLQLQEADPFAVVSPDLVDAKRTVDPQPV